MNHMNGDFSLFTPFSIPKLGGKYCGRPNLGSSNVVCKNEEYPNPSRRITIQPLYRFFLRIYSVSQPAYILFWTLVYKSSDQQSRTFMEHTI